jgi:hypothetical protein
MIQVILTVSFAFSQYTIMDSGNGKYWIKNKHGVGFEITDKELYETIDKIFKERVR